MASTEQPTSILRPLVDDLHDRRAQARLGGGEEKIERQPGKGALTARERLALLYDGGEVTQPGIHAGLHYALRRPEDQEAPARGVIPRTSCARRWGRT